MSFIYPEFLLALFSLAIPILVHLFNFRRFKKIYFTNVRFLHEIKQDTQSRSRLKHLLILLSRILALSFLVFAFAQPYLPANQLKLSGAVRKISVFVDNSFSMDALSKNGSLIEVAKKKAREIAQAYKPSDQFQLLTNDFEARHQRLISREEFLQEVDGIQPGVSVRSFTEIVERQEEALHSAGQDSRSGAFAYVISDFQKSMMNLPELKTDTNLRITLVPLAPVGQRNLFVDTCFLSTPFVQLNIPQDLIVRVQNIGESDVENISLKLTINSIQKSLASVSVPANSFVDTRMTFTISESGWQSAELSIPDYPVTFDDQFYFSFNVRSSIHVLCLNGPDSGPYLEALFGKDSYFDFRTSSSVQVDYSSFPRQQLILLNEIPDLSSGLIQELKNYVTHGGSLFLIPAAKINFESYRSLMELLGCAPFVSESATPDKVSRIESGHAVFSDVFENKKPFPENLDLPVVNKYFIKSSLTKSREEIILRLQNGFSFLGVTQSGQGKVYTLAVPLNEEYSNFARHALFVPIFLKAALEGSSEIHQPLVLGRDLNFEYRDSLISGDHVFHLKNDELKFDIIPEGRIAETKMILSFHDQVKSAGNYSLTAGNKLLSVLSFNYDRKESSLQYYNFDELRTLSERIPGTQLNILEAENKDLSHSLAQLNEGTQLWKLFIILALASFALEILLIRFLK